MRRILFAITLALLFAGCGKRGPLIPPEALHPAPVADLQVRQTGNNFEVTWSIPTQNEGKRPLKDLAGFRLFKREVLPPAEDCESCPDAYRLFKNIDLEYLQDIRRFGNSLYCTDSDVIDGKTYQYKVISYRKDGTSSRDSNKARYKKVVPASPPQLTAHFSDSGAVLRWENIPVSANVKVLGYNIYKRRADSSYTPFPLNDSLLTGTVHEDLHLERGVSYAYTLRTIAEVDGERVESGPSNEVQGMLAEPE